MNFLLCAVGFHVAARSNTIQSPHFTPKSAGADMFGQEPLLKLSLSDFAIGLNLIKESFIEKEKMKDWICIYAIALFITGCSISQTDEADEIEVKPGGNPAKCSQHGEKIYCDWEHVTDNWNNASEADSVD